MGPERGMPDAVSADPVRLRRFERRIGFRIRVYAGSELPYAARAIVGHVQCGYCSARGRRGAPKGEQWRRTARDRGWSRQGAAIG